MTEDLELKIESTWIENDNPSGFDRVIIVEFWTADILSSQTTDLSLTVGKGLRNRVIKKLHNDLGLVHNQDYIFGVYDNPKMSNGTWISKPIFSDQRVILRMRQEEHFAMFKLHYTS